VGSNRILNTRTKKQHLGFQDITAKEGLKRLLRLLANQNIIDDENDTDINNDNAGNHNHRKSSLTMRPPTRPIIRSNTRLELVTLIDWNTSGMKTNQAEQQQQQHQQQRNAFIRYRIRDLFPTTLPYEKYMVPP
jgi:hypothetical protein